MAWEKVPRSLGQRYYVGALRSAHSAKDDGFGTFVLAEMGIHISDSGDTAARVKLIDTPIGNAPSAPPPAAASYLYLHQAEALSRDTQHEAAKQVAQPCLRPVGHPPRRRRPGLARPVRRGPAQVH